MASSPTPNTVTPDTVTRRMVDHRCSIDSSCLRRANTDTPTRPDRPHRRCSFGSVSVREHEQTLGDNPSCQEGAPISLGWKVTLEKSVTLDEFERTRKHQRRRRSELVLGAAERRKLLVMNGSTTLMDVLHAERLVALKNGVASMGKKIGKNIKNVKPKSQKKAMTYQARAA